MTFLRNAVALEKTEHFFSYGTGSIYFSRSQFADDRNLYDIFLLFLALQYIQGAGEIISYAFLMEVAGENVVRNGVRQATTFYI